ncbi:MAG: tRNA (N(6)-L-threonylcarbamoyladenosine(37)-C(2))-methylthiotransferase MtaB [Parvularculales bacterium]
MTGQDNDVSVITHGCRLNTSDSDVVRLRAQEAGLKNAVIVNTCAVTAEAVRQARQTLRRARRENPTAQIIATGCAVQIEPQNFAAMSEVDMVLGNEEKLSAYSYTATADENNRVKVGDIMRPRPMNGHSPARSPDRTRGVVQIQTGCNHRCTFCIIPFGRGNARSLAPGHIVAQTRRLVDEGCREIVLTGVDITAYGADLPDRPTLGWMVDYVLHSVPDLARLRLSSLDPAEMDDHLLGLIADEKRFMPHLHLSMQSGDSLILKRMKRRHTREQAIALCGRLRDIRPDIVFGADLIAGFPTETEAMLENSISLVEECGLTWLHVFPFSPRPGTPAARMPPVDPGLVRERAARLRHTGKSSRDAFLDKEKGNYRRVLMETTHKGRTPHFVPVILRNGTATPGDILNVLLEDHEQGVCGGVPVS